MSFMNALSLRLPLFGTGAMYGESVSSTIRSNGMTDLMTCGRTDFLNVTMPPMPNMKFSNFMSSCASSSLPAKQWKTPRKRSPYFSLEDVMMSTMSE